MSEDFKFKCGDSAQVKAILARATTYDDSDSDFSDSDDSEEPGTPRSPLLSPETSPRLFPSSPMIKALDRMQGKKSATGKVFVHSPAARCLLAKEAKRLLEKKKPRNSFRSQYYRKKRNSLPRAKSIPLPPLSFLEQQSGTAGPHAKPNEVQSTRERSNAHFLSPVPNQVSTPGLCVFESLEDLPMPVYESFSDDDDLPFPYPDQPKRCPDNPIGEEMMYFSGDNEEWYPMIVTHYSLRGDVIDVTGKELFEGEEWSLEFKMKIAFEEGHLIWMNEQLAVKEEKIEHFEKVFSLIDESQNGDLAFADFVKGIAIYKKAGIPLLFTEEQLKEIFCLIHGDCELDDVDMDDDDYIQLEQSDFVAFALSGTRDKLARHFINVIQQPNIPERKLVLCKATDKFVPESQIVYCVDCGCNVWERSSRTHACNEGSHYCPKCFQRHICNQIRVHYDNNRRIVNCGRWEIEPRYLEEGDEDEDIFCIECYARKFAHDVTVTFNKFPLPFKLDEDSNRPYIKSPSKQLQVDDIVEGSLLRCIDGKRVGHRPPNEVKFILAQLAPPIAITFRSFVPVYHKLQKLKNFFMIAGIAGWSEEQILTAKGDSDAEISGSDNETEELDQFNEEDLPAELMPPLLREASNLVARLATFDNRIDERRDLEQLFDDTPAWVDDSPWGLSLRGAGSSLSFQIPENEEDFSVMLDDEMCIVEEMKSQALEDLLEQSGARLVSKVMTGVQLDAGKDNSELKSVEVQIWYPDLEEIFEGSTLGKVWETVASFADPSFEGGLFALHFSTSEGTTSIIPDVQVGADGYATFQARVNSRSTFAVIWAEDTLRLLIRQDDLQKQIIAFLYPPEAEHLLEHMKGERRNFWCWQEAEAVLGSWSGCAVSKDVLSSSDTSRLTDFEFPTQLEGGIWRGVFLRPRGGANIVDSVTLRQDDTQNRLQEITKINTHKKVFVEVTLSMTPIHEERSLKILPSISESEASTELLPNLADANDEPYWSDEDPRLSIDSSNSITDLDRVIYVRRQTPI